MKLSRMITLGMFALGSALYAQERSMVDKKTSPIAGHELVRGSAKYELTGNFTSKDSEDTYFIFQSKEDKKVKIVNKETNELVKVFSYGANHDKEETSFVDGTFHADFKVTDQNKDGLDDIAYVSSMNDKRNTAQTGILYASEDGFENKLLEELPHGEYSLEAPEITSVGNHGMDVTTYGGKRNSQMDKFVSFDVGNYVSKLN